MPLPRTLSHLPLFPLGTVLFPGGVLPLRIFEVRYLHMVARCHQRSEPFGVVALQHGSEVRRPGQPPPVLHGCGTLARITALHAPQPGLLLAQCEGGQRFRLHAWRQQPDGLWTGDVSLLDPDRATPIPPDLASLADALRHALELPESPHQPAHGAPAPELFQDAGWVANRWCERLPLPLTQKQQLMALDNPLVRLELISDLVTLALGAAGRRP
ncbi:MAG: LON peptidase substrate-binding domain-containing protein [Comamonadaceae bacterium]|nr:LON peptidase substrate-binding domain-containing protein [Comamonadaceae bacterium]RRD57419.1 peptidase S16 [Comamonadaceae bacterium OH2545_COT-014]